MLKRWLGVVSIFIAPTTIVTGLCFYFGYATTRAYFAYFGVDSDAVSYATGDYLLKSVSVLYPPLVVLLFGAAAVLCGGEYARRVMKRGLHPRLMQALTSGLIVVGALSTVRGLLGVALPRHVFVGGAALTPIALVIGIGALALGYWIFMGSRPRTDRSIAPTVQITLGLAAAVVVLAMFWITNIFATAYGANRAEAAAASLWTKESTLTLYTSEPLDAPPKLIAETVVGQQPTLSYRYQCLRGLAVHGNRWVLVPARWTPEFGYAVFVDVGATNRLTITRLKGIAGTPAADWNGAWQCPEVAPRHQ